MTVLVGALCGVACAADPDFSNVPDILHGERHLLRIDDLAIAGVWNPNTQALAALLQTSDSTITQATSSRLKQSPDELCPNFSNVVAAGGRMFNLDHDVVLSVVAELALGVNAATCNIDAVIDPDGLPVLAIFSPGYLLYPITQFYAVVADFTGDGYDDIVFAGNIFQGTGTLFQVLTAVDPDNPSQGAQASPLGGPFTTNAQLFALATSIFQAPSSGQTPPRPQLAWLSTNASSGKGLEIGIFSVDPSSLAVNFTGKAINLTLPEGANADVVALGLAAGHFSDATYDQLVVVYTVLGGTAKLTTIDFDAQGNPVQASGG